MMKVDFWGRECPRPEICGPNFKKIREICEMLRAKIDAVLLPHLIKYILSAATLPVLIRFQNRRHTLASLNHLHDAGYSIIL